MGRCRDTTNRVDHADQRFSGQQHRPLRLVSHCCRVNQLLTVNHNSSNRPVVFHFFEFPAGTTFVAAATAISLTPTGANPNLTGLTGTNTVMAAQSLDCFPRYHRDDRRHLARRHF